MSLIACKLREQVATLKEDLRHEIANAQWEANRANDALEQVATEQARVKELEEALREMVTPVGHLDGCLWKADMRMPCQCAFTKRINDKLAKSRALLERTSAPVDRHASPNQDDVAEQSRESREFLGGTK